MSMTAVEIAATLLGMAPLENYPDPRLAACASAVLFASNQEMSDVVYALLWGDADQRIKALDTLRTWVQERMPK